jgi:hypothetical protein
VEDFCPVENWVEGFLEDSWFNENCAQEMLGVPFLGETQGSVAEKS